MDMAIDPVLRRYAERSSQVRQMCIEKLLVGHALNTLLCFSFFFLPPYPMHQPRIDAHFLTYHGDTRFAKIASDRLREAVVQITGKRTSLALGGSGPAPSTSTSKRSKQKSKNT